MVDDESNQSDYTGTNRSSHANLEQSTIDTKSIRGQGRLITFDDLKKSTNHTIYRSCYVELRSLASQNFRQYRLTPQHPPIFQQSLLGLSSEGFPVSLPPSQADRLAEYPPESYRDSCGRKAQAGQRPRIP